MSDNTKLEKLGFKAADLKGLSPKVKALTRTDLVQLVQDPAGAPAALDLTFRDLQGLHALAAKAVSTGGGGGGDGGVRCCCCVACCCCCCAVAVSEPELVTLS